MRPVLALNLVLLALSAIAIAVVQLLDRPASAVDAVVHDYALAITQNDADRALADIAPDTRADASEFVREQAGNEYQVISVSVRSASLLDWATRRGGLQPTDATVTMDVNRDSPGDFFQPTTRVGVVQVDGRWLLAQPLLANP